MVLGQTQCWSTESLVALKCFTREGSVTGCETLSLCTHGIESITFINASNIITETSQGYIERDHFLKNGCTHFLQFD